MGVMSYRGYLIQIQIPNPPFDHTPETDDELLGRVIVNFLRNQGIAPTEFEIYQVQLIDLSEGSIAAGGCGPAGRAYTQGLHLEKGDAGQSCQLWRFSSLSVVVLWWL